MHHSEKKCVLQLLYLGTPRGGKAEMNAFTMMMKKQVDAVTDLAENMAIMKREWKDMKRSAKSPAAQLSEKTQCRMSSKKVRTVVISESDTSDSVCETDSDGFVSLNSLMESEKPEENTSDEEELAALKKLSDFLGDEEMTGADLNPDLAKVMEKLFEGKNNPEKVKGLSAKYHRLKNMTSLSAPRVN